MEKSKKICVVGGGRWGLNHIRTLYELNSLGAVVDRDDKVLKHVTENFNNCQVYQNLDDENINKYDGFIIATNPSSHFSLAKKVILKGKPVLVEKPLTMDYKSSKVLCDLANERNVNLMVGHILLFHPAFQKMKELVDGGKVGEIQYIYSNRLNMGRFRTNENVFWSFAPHDIALFNYFFNQKPTSVSSNGIDILQPGIHDSSITSFNYDGKKMGHIFVSWLHPFKEHRFIIIGSEGMLHFEDSGIKKSLLFYDNKAEFINSVPNPKNGEITDITFSGDRPLTNELKYFISKLNSEKIEVSSGIEGLDVIKILEDASNSLIVKNNIDK